MEKLQLEFRGIRRSHLEMYFEELGGVKSGEQLPAIYYGDNWTGKILSEKEVTITSTFKINSVIVEFAATTKEQLNELIKKYRYKTFRVGG